MRPEHPPGCTATRRRRSSRPSCSSRLRTLSAAASVRPTPCVAAVGSRRSSSWRDRGVCHVTRFYVAIAVLRRVRSSRASSSASARIARWNVGEVQRLVRAVRPRVGVLDAGDEDLRRREPLDEVGDERDRAARPRSRPARRRSASCIASSASATAQPLVSTRNGCPRSRSSISSWAPNGACARRCASSASKRLARRLAGRDARADPHARRSGSSVLDALRDARRVDAGDRDRRLVPDARRGSSPVPIGSTPSSRPASSRSCSSSYVGRLGLVAREPVDGDRAVRRPSRVASSSIVASIASGHRSPEHAGVRGVLEGATRVG